MKNLKINYDDEKGTKLKLTCSLQKRLNIYILYDISGINHQSDSTLHRWKISLF